jgi:hypothetical protein
VGEQVGELLLARTVEDGRRETDRALDVLLVLAPADVREPVGCVSNDQPFAAAQPRCVSSTWPTFMRDGTPSGLSTMSTGVPSARNGMSSTGRIFEMTPLLPWRPASLSPSEILRLVAM